MFNLYGIGWCEFMKNRPNISNCYQRFCWSRLGSIAFGLSSISVDVEDNFV